MAYDQEVKTRSLMKSLIVLLAVFSMNTFATEIEITSEDCNYEVRKERDSTILRVDKIISVENSISFWDIELPDDKIKLPLEDGMKTKLLNPFGEETVITYKNGILIHDHKAKSNFTRDTLELSISADLKRIRHAKFTRKGTGLLFMFGREKFECKF